MFLWPFSLGRVATVQDPLWRPRLARAFLTRCPTLWQDFLGEEKLKKLLNWLLKYLAELDVGLFLSCLR